MIIYLGLRFKRRKNRIFIMGKNGVIYMYTSPSGKKYVGQTWNEPKRRWEHRSTSGKPSIFHHAIKKYGKDNFVYEILHSNIETQEEMNRLEIEYIEKFNTIAPNGYNIQSGGSGGKHNDETKQKLRNLFLENYDKYVSKFKEAASRPEVRERLRQNGIKNGKDKNVLEKRSKSLKKAFSSDECRQKRSAQRKAQWADPEIRKKMETSLKEARSKEDYKARQVEILKERWKSEEYREHMKNKLTGRTRSQSAKDETAKKNRKPILCVETGQIFDSATSAAIFAGVARPSISSVLNKPNRTAGGYRWRHAK